jgi:hypothetical protein
VVLSGRLTAFVIALGGVAMSLVGGCAAPGSSPSISASPLDSGIQGTVLLGPTCPVEQAGQSPCVTPYPGVLVITDTDEHQVARITAGGDGRFRLALAPGDYVILPEPGDPFPQAQPIDVTVVPGQFADVQVNYDSGIR